MVGRMHSPMAWSRVTSAWKVCSRQVLEAQVVEAVVGVVEAEDGEVLGRLEDAGDLEAGLGGVVNRGGCGATGEALKLEGAAGVEEEEVIRRHVSLPEVGLATVHLSHGAKGQRGDRERRARLLRLVPGT